MNSIPFFICDMENELLSIPWSRKISSDSLAATHENAIITNTLNILIITFKFNVFGYANSNTHY